MSKRLPLLTAILLCATFLFANRASSAPPVFQSTPAATQLGWNESLAKNSIPLSLDGNTLDKCSVKVQAGEMVERNIAGSPEWTFPITDEIVITGFVVNLRIGSPVGGDIRFGIILRSGSDKDLASGSYTLKTPGEYERLYSAVQVSEPQGVKAVAGDKLVLKLITSGSSDIRLRQRCTSSWFQIVTKAKEPKAATVATAAAVSESSNTLQVANGNIQFLEAVLAKGFPGSCDPHVDCSFITPDGFQFLVLSVKSDGVNIGKTFDESADTVYVLADGFKSSWWTYEKDEKNTETLIFIVPDTTREVSFIWPESKGISIKVAK